MTIRIQYKRGQKLPANCTYVGRPSPWGNPYKIEGACDRNHVIDLYRTWLYLQVQANPVFLRPLEGHNLACWCKLTEKCHADILLELLELGL